MKCSLSSEDFQFRNDQNDLFSQKAVVTGRYLTIIQNLFQNWKKPGGKLLVVHSAYIEILEFLYRAFLVKYLPVAIVTRFARFTRFITRFVFTFVI